MDLAHLFTGANWMDIAGVIAAFILLFDRVAKLTATKKDDAVLAWLYKIANVLSIRVIPPADEKK